VRALVLGASGFIGAQVARALLDAGHTVRAFSRSAGPALALDGIEKEVERFAGDLRDSSAVERALVGCDALYHAAGYYPTGSPSLARALADGVGSVRPVFEAATRAGVERVVYTSSLTTVGRPGEPGRVADERDYYLLGSTGAAYLEAKAAMELEAYRFAAQGLPIVIVCPTACFGPGDVKPTSGVALLSIARGQVPVYVSGEVNVVDVRDVARSQVAAGERGRVGERYILGGTNASFKELLTEAAAAAGVPPPRIGLPRGLAIAVGGALARPAGLLPLPAAKYLSTGVGQIALAQPLSSAKAERELGHTHRPLRETVDATLGWFREHGYL
jgi:dihydroflavonol-4-reductase